MTSRRKDPNTKYYYFIDIDLYSRQIVGWDSDTQNNVDFGELTNDCYRVFLTEGQYNKLVKQLDEARLCLVRGRCLRWSLAVRYTVVVAGRAVRTRARTKAADNYVVQRRTGSDV